MQFSIGSQALESSRRFEVRVVSQNVDPFAGLKGHDYIKARNLAPPVQRVQLSAHVPLPAPQEVRK